MRNGLPTSDGPRVWLAAVCTLGEELVRWSVATLAQTEPRGLALMARQGSTSARGYGFDHQRVRAQLIPLVAAGGVVCARCGRLISPGVPWDLGHTEDRRAYTGPEHRRCNRSEGGRRGGRARLQRRRTTNLEW